MEWLDGRDFCVGSNTCADEGDLGGIGVVCQASPDCHVGRPRVLARPRERG
ncbi:hypothetical protein DB30_06038 [Enhygromyxa salina]|uniref:Uncharacterized protein n=1 Tax=Enhygromyxa salina TaxID=215803 RepID=A0A0C2CV70_9BACT|nr:hypothetical protein DB30_06038 [Enhygromyxa salina]